MKLKKWELALIVALAVTFLCGAAVSNEQQDLSGKLIRLHVVANSDSADDQALKLKVRDGILEQVSILLKDVTDQAEAVKLLEANISQIIKASTKVVSTNGYKYAVTAGITQEEFPTRDYDTFSLPAGEYTALRVVIGSGKGHNWWCVVFPPLCLTAATDSEETMQQLTDEQIKLITSDEPEYVLKFKSIEFLSKLKKIVGI